MRRPDDEARDGPASRDRSAGGRGDVGDALLLWGTRGAAAIAGGLILVVAVFVTVESLPALREIGPVRFFTDPSWHPGEGTFDLRAMLAGTLLVTLGAVALAVPLGLASALFSRHYAPAAMARPYRRILELLAGIPSVVYGFWGLVVLVPILGRLQPPGPSLLAGSLVLGLMILPTIALTSDAAIAAVPSAQLRAAASLGLTRWTTIRGVLLPSARGGIATGVVLSVGRAVGETMVVLMVCGNVVQMPASVFDPVRTLTANIALEMSFALGHHRSALYVSGLLLLMLVAVLVSGAGWIDGRERAG